MKEHFFKNDGRIVVSDDCAAACVVAKEEGADIFLHGETDKVILGLVALIIKTLQQSEESSRFAFICMLREKMVAEGLIPKNTEIKILFRGEEIPDKFENAVTHLLLGLLKRSIKL